MNAREIIGRIEQVFGETVLAASDEDAFPFVLVEAASLEGVFEFCRKDREMRLDYLDLLTALDEGQELCVIYHLFSTAFSHRLNVKSRVSRHQPRLPTATRWWGAARNHELEAAEMLGIEFAGHPTPRNLLLPARWRGFPLRKDYVFPEEVGGIEHRRAPMRKEHARP